MYFTARALRVLSATGLLILITACTGNGLKIGNNVSLCCPGDYQNYHSFGIVTEELPLFMRDYVVGEFTYALEERGLTRNDQINDLRVVLRYRHVNLNADQQYIDPFVPSETGNVELRYIANIDIVMKETATNKEVWAGHVHRIHTVSPGEYMHTPRAAAAFRETFRDLLQHYPALTP
jgi:hypothetical protein